VASMQAVSAASTLLDLRKQQEENLLYLHKMSVASHAIKIKS